MNIHLSEILVVLIVALLVIKPEQLPMLARKLGQWVAWARSTLSKIKGELDSHE